VLATAVAAVFTTAATTPAGPSIPHDLADPTILVVGRTFYAYSTASRYGSRVLHVPVTSSASPTGGWGRVRDAMPELPRWLARSLLVICHRGDFDAIDPKPFSEHGKHYLVYSAAAGATTRSGCRA